MFGGFGFVLSSPVPACALRERPLVAPVADSSAVFKKSLRVDGMGFIPID